MSQPYTNNKIKRLELAADLDLNNVPQNKLNQALNALNQEKTRLEGLFATVTDPQLQEDYGIVIHAINHLTEFIASQSSTSQKDRTIRALRS